MFTNCVAACCSVLQCVLQCAAVCCSVFQCVMDCIAVYISIWQTNYVAVCCSVNVSQRENLRRVWHSTHQLPLGTLQDATHTATRTLQDATHTATHSTHQLPLGIWHLFLILLLLILSLLFFVLFDIHANVCILRLLSAPHLSPNPRLCLL